MEDAVFCEAEVIIIMNPYLTGNAIRTLREQRHLTQSALAELLHVSDKTISKWETGKGYPDISLLEPIASVFGISLAELLSGSSVENRNRSANMLRTVFYVCPLCGNVFFSSGEAAVSCHGILLKPETAEEPDEAHFIRTETVEDELFVSLNHPMTRTHHISFLAGLYPDRVTLLKLYPEGPAEGRLQKASLLRILAFCNRDGLFGLDTGKEKKGIFFDHHHKPFDSDSSL